MFFSAENDFKTVFSSSKLLFDGGTEAANNTGREVMTSRRLFLAGLLAGPAMTLLAGPTAARPDLSRVPTRNAPPLERLYATPHGKPNALDVSPEGIWIMDQDPGSWASLVEPESGNLIREVQCENVLAASGVCVDEDGIWVGSTYNRLIVLCDPTNGDMIAHYPTPGAGLIYDEKGDADGRRSEVPRARPPSPDLPRRRQPSAVFDRPNEDRGGALPSYMTEAPAGTGAHAILSKDGYLYFGVPPARAIFVIDKSNWEVQAEWPTAGKRPHGSFWASADKDYLWCSDSNLNAFFRHDVRTGEIVERLQLPDDPPVIHGATLHDGHVYVCDDVGWMFRFRI